MTKRRFINSLAGLLVAACVAVGSVPLPTGFFKPASSSSSSTLTVTSGLLAWWEADAITGLNDGDAVTTWPDQSTSARDATQATGAKKPLFRTSVFGSKPAVEFDGQAGNNHHLTFTGTNLQSSGFTFVMVWVTGSSAGGTYAGPFSWSSSGFRFLYVNGGGSGNFTRHLNCVQVGLGDVLNKEGGSAPASGTKTLDVWTWNGTSGSGAALRINGADAGALSNGASAFDNGAPYGLGVSTFWGSTSKIAAVLVYNRVLSAGEITTVETYLNGKYAVY